MRYFDGDMNCVGRAASELEIHSAISASPSPLCLKMRSLSLLPRDVIAATCRGTCPPRCSMRRRRFGCSRQGARPQILQKDSADANEVQGAARWWRMCWQHGR